MPFPFNVYALAVAAGCLTTLLALPLWRRWCIRTGLLDDPGHRKIHDRPIPLAGGLAIMTGLLVPTLIASAAFWPHSGDLNSASSFSQMNGTLASLDADAAFRLRHGLGRRWVQLAGIILGAFGMLCIGWLDDKHELRPRTKFIWQLFVAALVAASGVRITLFVHNIAFHFAITILWILTLINAFNFMDNMNGLCAGLAAIGALLFGLFAAAAGQYLVALIAFLALGAILGFVPFNFPRARAFLGDSGSHLLGYLMAVLAILPHFYTPRHPKHLAVLIPLLILAVPLLDLIWVVVLRWRRGLPFYQGDTNHLSHRLVRLGLSPTRAVLAIWLLALVIGALAFVLGS